MKIRTLITFIILFSIAKLQAAEYSFDVSLTLLEPLVISETRPLIFPANPIGEQVIKVATDSSSAGQFSITGSKSAQVSVSISNITLTNGKSVIEIDSWDIKDHNQNKVTSIDDSGSLKINVGASAHIDKKDSIGTYSGTAKLAIVYN